MTILNLQASATEDDLSIHYYSGESSWVANVNFHYIGHITGNSIKHGGGLRFLNLNIPKESVISTAYLTFKSAGNYSLTTVNSRIIGELTGTPSAFSTVANYQGRRGTDCGGANNNYITTAKVAWDNIGAWTTNTEYQSPEIKTIIQEIVDTSSIQNLVLFVDDHEGRSTAVDTTSRIAYGAYYTSNAPKLHIEYISTSDFLQLF